ncbi:MAG: hypothetical protein H6817_05105 [Phycisphaerales bacterium]|nr:hypothetical protein [Phycisphaerales bacterium]
MKTLPSIIAAIILVVILAAYACTFQVRSTEVAILKTFGKAQEEPIEVDENDQSFFAGLHLKWPWPIQSVAKYDRRLRLLEDRIEETPTIDDRQIIVTTFTAWTISDPYEFHLRNPKLVDAENALRSRIRSYKKSVIGRHRFSEFVSDDPSDRKMEAIEEEIREAIAADARKSFGIDIQLFGIKQIGLPANVSEEVFNAMKADKQKRAAAFKAQGNAEGDRIVAEAQSAAQRIRSVVQRKVSDIESEGLTEVGKVYAEFKEHPELRIFLDQLRALEKILTNRTEIFMDADFAPVNLFDPAKRMNSALPGISHVQTPPANTANDRGKTTEPANTRDAN